MAVRLNDDKEMVQTIRDGLKRTGGYAPAAWSAPRRNKCMCASFGSRSPTRTSKASATVCSTTRTSGRTADTARPWRNDYDQLCTHCQRRLAAFLSILKKC